MTNRTGTHCPSFSSVHPVDDPHDGSELGDIPRKRACNFGLPPVVANSELVATFFQPGFSMSATEKLKPHQIVAYDFLSVTVQFEEKGENCDDVPAEREQTA